MSAIFDPPSEAPAPLASDMPVADSPDPGMASPPSGILEDSESRPAASDRALLRAEPELDGIARLAARMLDVPIAIITMFDGDQAHIIGKSGCAVDVLPLDASICDQIRTQGGFVQIADLWEDGDNLDAFHCGDPLLRFAAGAPLHLRGAVVGSVCCFDHNVRELDGDEEMDLLTIADQVVTWIELRTDRAMGVSAPAAEQDASAPVVDPANVHIDLAVVTGDALSIRIPEAAERGVRLQLVACEVGALVAEDAGYVRGVLDALLENALRSTPHGGTVRMRLAQREERLRVEVRDDGPSLSEEQCATFFDSDSVSEDRPGREDPILRRCRELALACGGDLGVDGGIGCTFWFELDRVFPQPAADWEESADGDERPRVLVCDADTAVAANISKILDGLGVEVVAVRSAAEARSSLASDAFEAAAIELDLPDADGVDLLEYMTITHPEIPTMIFSTREAGPVAEALATGIHSKIDCSEADLAEKIMLQLAGSTQSSMAQAS